MGKLEDLIAQVEDVALRQSLAAAASEAKEARNFGLVFEQHIPETVAVLGLPLRRGQRVRLRGQIDAGPDFTVVKAAKKMAMLQADDGSTLDVPAGDVAVVKRFGEAIYPTLTPIGKSADPMARPTPSSTARTTTLFRRSCTSTRAKSTAST